MIRSRRARRLELGILGSFIQLLSFAAASGVVQMCVCGPENVWLKVKHIWKKRKYFAQLDNVLRGATELSCKILIIAKGDPVVFSQRIRPTSQDHWAFGDALFCFPTGTSGM